MSDLTRTAIAQLREQLEQERTRAEAAEAELREEREASKAWEDAFKKAHANYAMTAEQLFQLRRVVDAWKAADLRVGSNLFSKEACEHEWAMREALRHA